MPLPLMPKATAMWLIDNTTLTFEQISEFTGIHMLEIQAMADGDVAGGIVGFDPILNGQLTKEEIVRCEQDENARLNLLETEATAVMRNRAAKYTPVAKRSDKPDAIMWILRNHPELSDMQICKLVGTTKPTIASVRDRTHKKILDIRPRNPITLGVCTEASLEKAVAIALDRQKKAASIEAAKEAAKNATESVADGQ